MKLNSINDTIIKCSNCEIEVPVGYCEIIDGGYTCPMCVDYYNDIQDQNTMVQVTREMAIDAQDLSLEGQWIRWN